MCVSEILCLILESDLGGVDEHLCLPKTACVWRGVCVPVCLCLWDMCSAPLLVEPANRKVAAWAGGSPGLGQLEKADTFSIP